LLDLHQSILVPSRRSPELRSGNHFVQLYEVDAELIDSVTTFVATGIEAGETAVVIADASHRRDIELRLTDRIDVDLERDLGAYIALDAEDTLSRFMIDGMPDQARFNSTLAPLLERAQKGSPTVRVFGEMVALLYATGRIDAAIRLEQLWNELARDYSFRLFCAYPANVFSEAEMFHLKEICSLHSQIVTPLR
jgi:hypothetical protein